MLSIGITFELCDHRQVRICWRNQMKFYIVDCFAEEKYQGNELLVIKADRHVSDEEQQKIAREINFSETTFILSDKKDDGGYDVRK